MNNKPEVSPSQWIKIGKKHAVVCNVHKDHIEVVYLDGRNRAINEDVELTCPQNWSSLKVSLRGFLDIGKFLRVVGFRSRWAIAQRAVGPDRVVLNTPLLDEYLSFP